MSQSAKMSAVESTISTVCMMSMAWIITQTFGVHILGIEIDMAQNTILTGILTGVSVGNKFGWRRIFNKGEKKKEPEEEEPYTTYHGGMAVHHQSAAQIEEVLTNDYREALVELPVDYVRKEND